MINHLIELHNGITQSETWEIGHLDKNALYQTPFVFVIISIDS